MKRPPRQPSNARNKAIPMREGPLFDELGKVAPAGRRRSDRLMDQTMERLRCEAEGLPDPVADVLQFPPPTEAESAFVRARARQAARAFFKAEQQHGGGTTTPVTIPKARQLPEGE